MSDERAFKIAQAAMKAQQRIDEQGGLPDIHVPGMEAMGGGGGGTVSGAAYIREAMGVSPDVAPKPPIEVEAGKPVVATPTRNIDSRGTHDQSSQSVAERTHGSLGVTIGESYGRGHTAKVIKRVMSEEKRVSERRGAQIPVTEGVRPEFDVNGALVELRSKDKAQIEYDTALTQAARAVAAYTLSIQSPDRAAQVLRFSEGDDYASEAREHASLVGDNGKLLRFVSEQMEQSRESALGNAVKPDYQR